MKAYSLLKSVWGDRQGIVFLPRAMDPSGRHGKKEWQEGRGFKYPEEEKAIQTRIELAEAEGYDIYWCPLVFQFPRRQKDNALPTQGWLWADLDYVDPTKIAVRPSIAWQSSTGRYHALWRLDADYTLDRVEEANKRLTYAIGADKGGWDVTQVLRIPGTLNHKYDPPQEVVLLWNEPKSYSLDYIMSVIPEPKDEDIVSIATGSLDDLTRGWGLSERAIKLIKTQAHEIAGEDRSERLWELETLLMEAGVPITTAVAIVKQTVWNKFAGRREEDRQLYKELLKADEKVKVRKRRVVEDEPQSDFLTSFSKFVTEPLPPPEWLVEGFWQKRTYGMVAGEPKTYKSVLTTDLVLSVASGQSFLGRYNVPSASTVLMIQDENNKQTVQDRVYKIYSSKFQSEEIRDGLSLSVAENLPIYFSNNPGVDLTNITWRERIEQTIKAIKPELIVLDPLYMMLGGADENDATEVRGILTWLSSLRNRFDLSIIIIHHYNKAKGSIRGGQNIRGTSQFHAWVECGLYIKTTTELNTIAIEREFRSFPAQGDIKVQVSLSNPGVNGYKVKILDLNDEDRLVKKEELTSLIAVRPYTLEELKSALNVDGRTVKKWLEDFIERGTAEKLPAEGRGKQPRYRLSGGDKDGDL